MILRNWHIEGFGCFHDCGLPEPGLSGGLNLITGANEAGKSTLLDFIRYTLFEYPDGRSGKPKREPLRGGLHGGSIRYEVEGASFRVGRWRRRNESFQLSSPDGTIHPEALYRVHTGHVTAEIFRNVFGFSLGELQAIDSLKGEEIVNLIFSAAIGESASRINSMRDRLRERADSIFKERARARSENAPSIIRLQSELAEVEARLAEARRRAEGAAGKVRELDEARIKEAALKSEEERLAARMLEVERLIQGWDSYVRLRSSLDAMEEPGDLSRFPPGGRDEWTVMKNGIGSALAALEECEIELRGVNEELERMPAVFMLIGRAAQAEALHEERAGYETACRMAADAAEKSAELDRRWSALIRELGGGWDERTVSAFDLSLVGEAQARQVVDPLQAAGRALEAAEERLARLEGCGDNKDGPATMAETGSTLKEEREWLAVFRDEARERDRLNVEARALETELRHVEVTVSASGARRSGPVSHSLGWALGAAGALAVGAVLFIAGQPLAGGVAMLFSVAFAGLGLAARRNLNLVTSGEDGNLANLLDEKRVARDEAVARLAEFDRRWAEIASGRGLSWPPKETEVARFEGNLAEIERRILRENEVWEARDEVARRRANLAPLLAEWREYLKRRSLPEEIPVETAMAIFEKVRNAAAILEELNVVRERIAAEDNAQASYLNRLKAFLKECGVEPPDDPSALTGALAELRREIESQREIGRKREVLETRRQEVVRKVEDRKKTLEARENGKQRFLESAGCASEADFYTLAEKVAEQGRLARDASAAQETINAVFGSAGAPPDLLNAWESGSRPDWESEREALIEEKRKAAAERESCIRQISTLRSDLERELGSGEIADLQTDAEALRAEIRGGIDEWLELSAALELLRITRLRYEEDHQPPALAEASRIFGRLTAGAYRQILMPLDSSELVAVTGDGSHKTVDRLSRGTLEQLFLCVRLGYIRHFQRQQNVRLPMLMDDVTVNFDSGRLLNIINVLQEFAAEGQQILFFSCHYGIADLLEKGFRRFELRDHSFLLIDSEVSDTA